MASNDNNTANFIVDEVYARVKKVVSSYFEVDPIKVSPGTSYINDLDADSLDPINLEMEFEDEFDLEIPDDCGDAFMTVGSTTEYIRKLLEKKNSKDG